jgi:UDP-glucuronate decarboxylase
MAIDDGRVVSNFLVQAIRGEDLTIFGDGKQTRSFCYVDDLVDGIYRFAHTENVTGPINLGNDREFTMLQLAEMVLKKVGGKSKLRFMPLPSDDPKQRRPDLTLAKATLKGWSPKTELEQGIEKSVPYFKAVLSEIAALKSSF